MHQERLKKVRSLKNKSFALKEKKRFIIRLHQKNSWKSKIKMERLAVKSGKWISDMLKRVWNFQSMVKFKIYWKFLNNLLTLSIFWPVMFYQAWWNTNLNHVLTCRSVWRHGEIQKLNKKPANFWSLKKWSRKEQKIWMVYFAFCKDPNS